MLTDVRLFLYHYISLKYHLLHQEHSDDACEDAEAYINDVMMAAVNGSPPNAEADEGKEGDGVPTLMAHHGIYRGDEHVGCMQTWHGCEDICVFAINAVEDV